MTEVKMSYKNCWLLFNSWTPKAYNKQYIYNIYIHIYRFFPLKRSLLGES